LLLHCTKELQNASEAIRLCLLSAAGVGAGSGKMVKSGGRILNMLHIIVVSYFSTRSRILQAFFKMLQNRRNISSQTPTNSHHLEGYRHS
jgi:hypothetical protein